MNKSKGPARVFVSVLCWILMVLCILFEIIDIVGPGIAEDFFSKLHVPFNYKVLETIMWIAGLGCIIMWVVWFVREKKKRDPKKDEETK